MKMHIAVAVALLATALTSLAQDTANLTLRGVVNDKTTILLDADPNANDLNLDEGENNALVAKVTETSNRRSGYTVTLTSQNAVGTQAMLKGGTAGNGDTINYSMTYDGTAVTLVDGSAVVTEATGRTPKEGVAKALAVTILPTWANTDNYSDMLTLTIKSN